MSTFAPTFFMSLIVAAIALPHVCSAADGGATRADAEAALASFKKLEPALTRALTLPKGEPRIVDSSTLAGLKPGFQVVTLGRCRKPEKVLAALKAIYPGAYAKPLTAETSEACPELTDTRVTAFDATAKAGSTILSAFALTDEKEDDREHSTSSSTVHFVLVDAKTGVVREVASVDGGGEQASGDGPAGREYSRCTPGVTVLGRGLLLTRACTDGRTGCGRDEKAIPTSWNEYQRVTVREDALKLLRPVNEIMASTPCVAGATEGD